MNFATKIVLALAAITTLMNVRAEAAPTVPFTENFAADTANWKNNTNADLAWTASGGPNGSSYVTTPFAFSAGFGDQLALFRAGGTVSGVPYVSSGGNFNGNWLKEVRELTAYVKHDADEPLDFFARLPTSAGSPAVSFLQPQAVPSGVWTKLSFDISFANPLHVNEGPTTQQFFNNTMAGIGRVQIGVIRPATPLGTSSAPVNFSLDLVGIVPEPATAGILLGVLICGAGFRRTRQC